MMTRACWGRRHHLSECDFPPHLHPHIKRERDWKHLLPIRKIPHFQTPLGIVMLMCMALCVCVWVCVCEQEVCVSVCVCVVCVCVWCVCVWARNYVESSPGRPFCEEVICVESYTATNSSEPWRGTTLGVGGVKSNRSACLLFVLPGWR